MSIAVKDILKSFEVLPDKKKREVAYEVLRKTAQFDFPPLTDEELINSADELFLELDRRESKNG